MLKAKLEALINQALDNQTIHLLSAPYPHHVAYFDCKNECDLINIGFISEIERSRDGYYNISLKIDWLIQLIAEELPIESLVINRMQKLYQRLKAEGYRVNEYIDNSLILTTLHKCIDHHVEHSLEDALYNTSLRLQSKESIEQWMYLFSFFRGGAENYAEGAEN